MPARSMIVRRVYDPSGTALMAGHDDRKQADDTKAAQIFEVLMRAYPGHYWMVHVDSEQGIACIKIPVLMTGNQTWIIHLNEIANVQDMRRIVLRAGGEILERYRIPRGGMDIAAFLTAKQRYVRLGRNDPVPE